MLLGTIALQSKARMTGMTVPADYTMFVFEDALVVAPLSRATSGLKLVGMAKGTKGISTVANVAAKRMEKKQRAAQDASLAELPDDLTAEQLTEHVDDAHVVAVSDIESVELKSAAFPLGHLRGVDLSFRFATKDVDLYVDQRLRKEKQHVTSDPAEAAALLTEVLGDKVSDARRAWGKR
jgi:hypothetical protein